MRVVFAVRARTRAIKLAFEIAAAFDNVFFRSRVKCVSAILLTHKTLDIRFALNDRHS